MDAGRITEAEPGRAGREATRIAASRASARGSPRAVQGAVFERVGESLPGREPVEAERATTRLAAPPETPLTGRRRARQGEPRPRSCATLAAPRCRAAKSLDMDTVALISIIGTGVTILLAIIGTGVTLGVIMQRIARRLDARITADKAAVDADRRAADTDRRAERDAAEAARRADKDAAEAARRADKDAAEAARRADKEAADAARHADKAAADADRRAADARFDAAIKAFRDEMRDLATRQAHLDGRLDGREAAAD